MKKSKLLAPILALAMLLALLLPMAASAAGEGATLTVTGPTSITLTAADFKAYKLFDVTVSTNPTSYAYTATTELSSFLTSASNPTGAQTDAAFQSYLKTATQDQMTALTKALNAYGFTAIDATQNGLKVQFSPIDYGYYLVASKVAPAAGGTKVTSHSSLVNVVAAATEITVKADAPSITKQVMNDNTNALSSWTDAKIGDTVNFQLKITLPDMTGYKSYSLIVHDTMSKGLTFNNDVTFTSTSAAITTKAVNITSSGVNSDTKFNIVFNSDEVVLAPGAQITINYTGTLNQYAVIGTAGNPNTVTMDYSVDPYSTSDTGSNGGDDSFVTTPGTGGNGGTVGNTPPATAIVYTFAMNLYKYTGAAIPGTPLAGAKFTIGSLSFVLVSAGDGTNASVYRVAKTGEAGADPKVTSPASGKITINGLDAGTYAVSETDAPQGFNKLDAAKTVVITHTLNAGVGTGNSTMTVDGTAQTAVNVQNNTGAQLPGTGGIGVMIFYAISALLTAGLAVFFVVRRKRNILNSK